MLERAPNWECAAPRLVLRGNHGETGRPAGSPDLEATPTRDAVTEADSAPGRPARTRTGDSGDSRRRCAGGESDWLRGAAGGGEAGAAALRPGRVLQGSGQGVAWAPSEDWGGASSLKPRVDGWHPGPSTSHVATPAPPCCPRPPPARTRPAAGHAPLSEGPHKERADPPGHFPRLQTQENTPAQQLHLCHPRL